MKRGKEPAAESKRGEVLAYVRRHPNCTTSEVAAGTVTTQRMARYNLKLLYASGWVGRQPGLDYHDYESRWLPELAEAL